MDNLLNYFSREARLAILLAVIGLIGYLIEGCA